MTRRLARRLAPAAATRYTRGAQSSDRSDRTRPEDAQMAECSRRDAASLRDRFLGSAAGRRHARAARRGGFFASWGRAPRAHRRPKGTALDSENLTDVEEPTAIDHFLAEGLITDVLRIVKTGKRRRCTSAAPPVRPQARTSSP